MRSWTHQEFIRRCESRAIELENMGGHAIERAYMEETARRMDELIDSICELGDRIMDLRKEVEK